MTAKLCATKTTTKPKHDPHPFIANRQPANGLAVLFSLKTSAMEVTKMVQVALAKREKKAIAQTIDAQSVVAEWLSEHRSENTRKAYARDLLDFCQTIYRTTDLRKALSRFLSLSEVEAGMTLTKFRQLLRERGAQPATINRKLSALCAFVDHARKRGIVNWRVTDLVKGEKQRTDPKERIRQHLPAVTVEGIAEALRKVLDALPDKGLQALRDKTIIALMALHGLHRVEVARLSLSDLIEEKEGLFSLRVFGKGDKIRIVQLRQDTTELLKRYLAALKRSKIEPIADAYGVPLFFSLRKQKGKRLTLQQINNIVDEAFKAAGLKRKGLSCHSLRHSFGTISATKRGVPIPDLAAYMGHSNISTTSLYAHAVGVVNPSAMIKELRAI
jgi:site-specific recombinase XerD